MDADKEPSFLNKLEKNLSKHYLFTLFARLNLEQGVWMLYMASKGLTFFQIGLMETIFHLTSFLMEVPTGAIADLYGRKVSRVIGRICSFLSTLLMLLSKDINMIGLAFVFSALGYNFESGAGDALIFDSMKELGKEESYVKVAGITETIMQSAGVIALVLGGYIAMLRYDLVYEIGLTVTAIALILALSFTEPTIGKVSYTSNVISGLRKQVSDSLAVLKSEPRAAALILLSEGFNVFSVTLFFYIQNYYKSLNYSELEIGIILAAGGILAAFAVLKAQRIKLASSLRTLMTFLPLAAIICFWGVLTPKLGFLFFILLTLLESLMFVLTGDAINQLIPSQQRATLLSLQSMLFSLFMMLLFPLIGKLADWTTLAIAFVVLAALATVVLLTFSIIVGRVLAVPRLFDNPAPK